MEQLSEKTVNHGDLAAFYDQHMQDVVKPNANKGIKNDAVCQTAAETAAKTIIAPAGFSLTNGTTIIVGFANAIGVANATFAIGTAVDSTADDYSEKNPATEGWCVLSGGTFVLTEDTEPQNGTTYYTVSAAKPIYYRGADLAANLVQAGDRIILRYDGTSYNVVGTLEQDISGKVDKVTGKGLSTNDYTTNEKKKLAGIAAGAEVNVQSDWNATSGNAVILNKPTIPAAAANGTYTVKTLVGSTTTNVSDFTANQRSADDVTFVQGSNVTITPDATNRKITIAAKDTTYSSKSASSGGTDLSLVTTGEKYNWNNKQNAIGSLKEIGFGFTTCSTPGGTAAKVANLSGFVLKEFAHVTVYFTNGFTTTGSTLNVNGTGAKPIYFCGSAIAPQKIANNTVVQMFYDGTNWNVTSIEYFGSTPVSGAVDLSLPSGVLWAERNVGASAPEDWGLFFSWGNVDGHSSSSGYDFSQTTYNGTTGAALSGDIAVGDTYDAARHNLGSRWRMPTQTEIQELIDNCDSVWTQRNDVDGRLFTSRINGNTVFFPAAGRGSGTAHEGDGNGYYWTSTLDYSTHGKRFDFNSYQIRATNSGSRYYGFTIRAVM